MKLTNDLREVTDKQSLHTYIYLTQKLYKNIPNWVHPIYVDEWKFHDAKQNPSLSNADVVRVIAYRNGEAIGRIMGIINKKYNEQREEQTARFFNFDCVNEQVVAHELIQYITQWAIAKGMHQLIGPFGFSDKDPQGLQIEGFEYLPVIATPSHAAYLSNLLEVEGFTKDVDCVSFKLQVPNQLPALYLKIHERICRNQQLRLVEFNTKKQLRPYIIPVFRLVNKTYANLFGFVPMSEAEMKSMARQYLPVLDPAFVKIVLNEKEELVGFVIAMPDMSLGIQKAKGKILPFGFLYMLSAARKTKQLNLLLGAIRPDYRGIGINVLLTKALIETAIKRKFEWMDSHLVLENNTLMCSEYRNLGGEVYKRYRVFKKQLA